MNKGQVLVSDDAPQEIRDLRGMVVEPDKLRDRQIALLETNLTTEGKPVLRMLTYEQVRMLRDMWVITLVQKGYTETIELAYAILTQATRLGHDRLVPGAPTVTQLFTCEPQEGEMFEQLPDLADKASDDPQVDYMAKCMGASILRCAQRGFIAGDFTDGL